MLLFLFAASMSGYAQSSKAILRFNAYFTVPTPGTIMVDENGNPRQQQRQKVYVAVIETKGIKPLWTKAWAKDKFFTLVSLPVNGDSVFVGKRKTDEKRIVLKASKGNFLQHIEFSPATTYQRPPHAVGVNEILLEGKTKGRVFYHKVSGLTELASPEYQ